MQFKSRARQTAAAMMALISMASMTPRGTMLVQANESTTVNKTGKEQAPPIAPVAANQTIVQAAGGFEVINHGRQGIPPHIYGAHYVRRGTHKRTNKK